MSAYIVIPLCLTEFGVVKLPGVEGSGEERAPSPPQVRTDAGEVGGGEAPQKELKRKKLKKKLK